MSFYSDAIFISLVLFLCGIGLFMLVRTLELSEGEVIRRLKTTEVVEMLEIRKDREYMEEVGRVLLPKAF